MKLKKVTLSLCFLFCLLFGVMFISFGSGSSKAYAATSTSAKCLTNGSYYTKSSPSYVRTGCPTSFYSIYMYSTNQNGSDSTIDNDTVLNWSYYYISVVPKNLDNHQTFTLTKDGVTYTSKTLSGNSEMVLYSGSLPSGSYVLSYVGDYDMGYFYKSETYYYSYRFEVDVSAPTYTLKTGSSSISSGTYTNQAVTYSISDAHTGTLYYKSPSNSGYSLTSSTSYTTTTTNGWWYFYATDAYGNTNSTVSVYIDTVEPVGKVTANGSTVSNGAYVNKAFSYTATDTGGITNYQIKRPNSSVWESYTSGTSVSGASGWYYFRSTDRAGNISDEYKVYYDSAAPVGTLYAGTTSKTSGSYVNSSYIKYTATDAYSGVANCYVRKPNTTSYVSYVSGTQLTAEGTYYFYSVDNAGNTTATVSITLDKTLPIGTVSSNGTTVASGTKIANSFSYSATDSGSGLQSLYYKAPVHSSYQTYTSGSIISASTGDGWYYFYALDRAGNQSATYSVYLDTTIPTLSMKGYSSGSNISDGAYVNERVIFTASDINFSRIYYKTPNASSYSYTSSTSYTSGTENGLYKVYAVDLAGNASAELSFYYDNVAPVGTITSNGQIIASGKYIDKSFSYSVTDSGSGVKNLFYKSPISGVFMPYTAGFVIPANSGDGWYYFYSVDNSGNQSATMSVYLETQAPLVEIYRNNELAYSKTITGAGTFDTDIYLNPNDKLKISCDTSSGKVTSNYTLDTNITIGSSYTGNNYTITLTSATGITSNFTYHIVRNKPTITIDGKTYSSGSILHFNSDKAVKFVDDSVISNSGNTGATISSEGSVNVNEHITYASGNGKTLTTANGTETKYILTLNDRAGNESHFTVFIDKLAPVGVWKTDGKVLANNGYTNKPLSFVISEAGVTATYSHNGGEYAAYTSGKTLTADGTYHVILTDLAGNKSIFTAYIDTVAPVGQIYADNKPVQSGVITNKSVFFSWDGDITATVNDNPYTKNSVLSEDGIYKFVLTDFAGNHTEYTATIDTTAPIYNTDKLTNSQQLISKWYVSSIDGTDYSFATYDEALAFACDKEFAKSVTVLVLDDVSNFNQHHLIADGSEVRVGEYWLYKSNADKERLLYYFDRNVLDDVIARYAKENISTVNYFDFDGDNLYGEPADSMTDNVYTALDGTKAPVLNGFIFDKADGSELYAELVGGNGEKVKIEYGIAFDKQVTVGGLYKFTELDEAGNSTVFYGFSDVLSPELKVSATIIGNNEPTELVITKQSLTGGAAFYYESFNVNEIADADKWAVLTVESNGKKRCYTYGDELPCLNVGGEYMLSIYDRLGNGYSFTVYIIGNPASIAFKNNADDTAFDLTITLEQKFDTLVSLEISKNGEPIVGVSTDTLSYTFDRAGTYTVTLRDNFGRTITKEYTFNKALPNGTFTGVENGGKTKSDVTFSFDADKYYAVVTKDGQAFATENSGEIFFMASDENSGKYAIRLIRLTDEENFIDYTFTVNTLAPEFALSVENNATTNKNVTVSWTAADVVSVIYSHNGGEPVELKNGDVLSAEGVYTVTAANDLGTQSVKTFTIDKTLDYDILVNDAEMIGVDTTNSDVTVVNNEPLYVSVTKNGEPFEFTFGQVLSYEGLYNFRVSDDYGNTTSFTVVIDKSVDVQLTTGNGVISNDDVIITAGEKVNFIATKDGVEYSYALGTAIKDEGAYRFTVYDLYGNEKVVTFQIVKGTKTKLNYTLGDSVEIESIMLDGEAVSADGNALNFTVDGTYTVVCKSEGKEYTFTLSLDTTAPTISLNGIEDGGKGNVTVTITDLSEEGTVTVYRDGEQIEYNLGDELKEYGSYEVRVSDELGNERVYKFVLEYQMNGGAIALFIIGIIVIVGSVVAIIVMRKRGIFGKIKASKSASKSVKKD